MTRRAISVSTTVLQAGVPILVSGTYMPGLPAKLTADPYNSEPAEGGYWVEYSFHIGGIDVTEFVEWISMVGSVDAILDKAAEKI